MLAVFASHLPGAFVLFLLLVQPVKGRYSQKELLVAFIIAWVLCPVSAQLIYDAELGVPYGARYLLGACISVGVVIGYLFILRDGPVTTTREPHGSVPEASGTVKDGRGSNRVGLILILIGVGVCMLSFLSIEVWYPKAGFMMNVTRAQIVIDNGITTASPNSPHTSTSGRVAIPLRLPLGIGGLLILIGAGVYVLRERQ